MKVHLVKDTELICFNWEKWMSSTCPVLIVTGLSGSGKTVFAEKIASQHNAISINFDVLKFYSEASVESQAIFDKFLEKYPEIQHLVSMQWCKTDTIYSNDILFNYYCNVFFDYMLEYSITTKKRIVLEGIQMFIRLHPVKCIGLPVVIMGKSCLKSFRHKVNRDYHVNSLYTMKPKYIGHIVSDFYNYHWKQRKLLNEYIKYLNVVNKNIV